MNVLNKKDLEWSAEHLPAAVSTESENNEEKENTEPAIEPPKKKVPCAKKVSISYTYSLYTHLHCATACDKKHPIRNLLKLSSSVLSNRHQTR